MSVLLGILSVAVHALGRCEPMSFILSFLILKDWKYVILRNDKIVLGIVNILAICLDFIWIAFAADSISQINFTRFSSTFFFTIFLLLVKMVLMIYVIFF